MKLSQIRELKHEFESWREIIESIQNDEHDFEIDNFRFIHEDDIDSIMLAELSSDTYFLGSFNADFLSAFLPLSYQSIEKLQKLEQFEALGEIALNHIEDIQSEYARLDGYGNHFAHYDGHSTEIHTEKGMFFCFRIN